MHPNEKPNPTQIEWQPVTVTLRGGRVCKICGPLDAFDVLNHLVGKDRKLKDNARRCCLLALEKKMSVDEARRAFVAATTAEELDLD